MAISIISATFMLSLMAIFAILRIVIEIANTKSGNTTDVGDEDDSTKNEEDSLLIDDSTILEILQEVCDWVEYCNGPISSNCTNTRFADRGRNYCKNDRSQNGASHPLGKIRRLS